MPHDDPTRPRADSARYARWLTEEEEREKRERELRRRESATREERTREVVAAAPKPPGAFGGTVDPTKFGFTRATAPAAPREREDFGMLEGPPVAPDVTSTAITEGRRQGEKALTGRYEGADRFETAAGDAMAAAGRAKSRGEYDLANELDRQSQALRGLALGTRTLDDDLAIRAYDEATLGLGMFNERQEFGRARATVDPQFLAEQGIVDPEGKRINLERPMRAKDFAASAIGIVPSMMGTRSLARAGAEFLKEGVEFQGKTYLTSRITQRFGRALESAVTSPVTNRAGTFAQRAGARAARGAAEGAATGAATTFTQTYAETEGDLGAAATAAALDVALSAPLGAVAEVAGGAVVDPFRRRLVNRTLARTEGRVQSMLDTGFLSPEEAGAFADKIAWARENQRTETVVEELDRLAEKRVTPGGEGPVYRGQFNNLTREAPRAAPLHEVAPAVRTSATIAGAGAAGAVAGAALAPEGERAEGAAKGAAIGAGVAGAAAASRSIATKAARRETSAIRAERDEARRLAETDELTQVGNRRAFSRARGAAEADPNTSIIRFDLNNFKAVNDALGHDAGDAALQRIAGVLREKVPGGRVFRPGGDEFSAIVPKADADRIRGEIEQAVGVTEVAPGVRYSISGGVGDTDAAADAAAATAKRAAKRAQGLPAERGAAPAPARFEGTVTETPAPAAPEPAPTSSLDPAVRAGGTAAAVAGAVAASDDEQRGVAGALAATTAVAVTGETPHVPVFRSRLRDALTSKKYSRLGKLPAGDWITKLKGDNQVPNAEIEKTILPALEAARDRGEKLTPEQVLAAYEEKPLRLYVRAHRESVDRIVLPSELEGLGTARRRGLRSAGAEPATRADYELMERALDPEEHGLDAVQRYRRELEAAEEQRNDAESNRDHAENEMIGVVDELVDQLSFYRNNAARDFRSRMIDSALENSGFDRLWEIVQEDGLEGIYERVSDQLYEIRRNEFAIHELPDPDDPDATRFYVFEQEYSRYKDADQLDPERALRSDEDEDVVDEWLNEHVREQYEESVYDEATEELRQLVRRIDDHAGEVEQFGSEFSAAEDRYDNFDEVESELFDEATAELEAFNAEQQSLLEFQERFGVPLDDEHEALATALSGGIIDPEQRELFTGRPEGELREFDRPVPARYFVRMVGVAASDAPPDVAPSAAAIARLRTRLGEFQEKAATLPHERAPQYSTYQRIGGGLHYRELLIQWPEWGADVGHFHGTAPNTVAHGRVEEHLVFPAMAGELALRTVPPRVEEIHRELGRIAGMLANRTEAEVQASPSLMSALEAYRDLSEELSALGAQGAAAERRAAVQRGLTPLIYTTVAEAQSDPQQKAATLGWQYKRHLNEGEKRALVESIQEMDDQAKRDIVSAAAVFEALMQSRRRYHQNLGDDAVIELTDADRANAVRATLVGQDIEHRTEAVEFIFPEYFGDARAQWSTIHDERQALLSHATSAQLNEIHAFETDADRALRRAGSAREEFASGVRIEGPPSGILHNPWDESTRTVPLVFAAALREAAEIDADGFSWSTAANRVKWAHTPVKLALLVYDQVAPKAVRTLMQTLGFKVEPKIMQIRGQDHWGFELTPEMKAAIKRIGFPMLGALLMLSVPQEEVDAQTGTVVAQPDGSVSYLRGLAGLDNADKFAIGATLLSAAVLGTTMKRAGFKAALREVTKGGAISPAAIGLMGAALQSVPDEDYDDFGKATMALAALKAIGARRFADAGSKFARTLVKAVASVPSGKNFVVSISPDLILPREVRTALDRYYSTKAKGEALRKEVETKAADLGPEGARKATDILRGETWEQQRFTADQLKAIFAIAADVANRTALLGKEKVNLGIITEAQHAASGGDQYLPRIYGYYEALKATALRRGGQVTSGDAVRIAQDKSRVLDIPVREAEERLATALRVYQSAQSGGRGQQSNLAPFAKEIIDAKAALDQAKLTMDQQRRSLGEIREIGYVAGYNFERGYSQVAAAQLFKVLRDVPGLVPDEYLQAFDQYEAASVAFNNAVDVDARQAARDRTELARLRLKTADKAIGSLIETRYKTQPSSSHRGRKLIEGYAAERIDAKEERADALAADRAAVDSDSRAAARQSMDDARRVMADIAQRYQAGNAEYVVLPASASYGALAGMPVKREVALGLFGGAGAGTPGFGARAWLKAMRGWKGTKTTLNPATHAGNTMSNAVMAHMNGLSLAAQPLWLARAFRELRQYGADARTLAERGTLNVTGVFEGSDVSRRKGGPDRAALLELLRTSTPETQEALRRGGLETAGEEIARGGFPNAGAAVDRFSDVRRKTGGFGVGTVFDAARKLYENEDNVFRVAVYMHAKAAVEDGGLGLPEEQALFNAEKGMIDFRSKSPLLRVLGNTVFPFIRYPVKALPTFARLIADHPERWLVLTSMLLALNEYGEQVAGEELSSEDVPFDRRGSGLSAAAPDLVQVPWGHDKGMGVPAVDFTRMTPISGLTTGAPPGTFAGEAGLPMVASPGGPLLDMAAALRYNIKPGAFNVDDKMIRYEDRDDPVSISKRIFEAARSTAAPPLLGYYLDEAREAVRTGDPVRKQNWWLSQIAMRPRYYVPGEQLDRAEYELEQAMNDIRYQERRRLKRTAPEGEPFPVFDSYEQRTNRARRVFEKRTGQPAPPPPRFLPQTRR